MCHLYEALMILPHCQRLCTYIWVQTSSSELDILRGRCTCKFKYPLPMCHVYGYCELINSYMSIHIFLLRHHVRINLFTYHYRSFICMDIANYLTTIYLYLGINKVISRYQAITCLFEFSIDKSIYTRVTES